MPEHTYRDAGVDIDLEARAVRALIDKLTYRRTGAFSMLGEVGHFAGLIDCGSYVLALAVDGVGTKTSGGQAETCTGTCRVLEE